MSGYGCTYCAEAFPDERALQAHVKFMHAGQPYKMERRDACPSMSEILGVAPRPAAGAAPVTLTPACSARARSTAPGRAARARRARRRLPGLPPFGAGRKGVAGGARGPSSMPREVFAQN